MNNDGYEHGDGDCDGDENDNDDGNRDDKALF